MINDNIYKCYYKGYMMINDNIYYYSGTDMFIYFGTLIITWNTKQNAPNAKVNPLRKMALVKHRTEEKFKGINVILVLRGFQKMTASLE